MMSWYRIRTSLYHCLCRVKVECLWRVDIKGTIRYHDTLTGEIDELCYALWNTGDQKEGLMEEILATVPPEKHLKMEGHGFSPIRREYHVPFWRREFWSKA